MSKLRHFIVDTDTGADDVWAIVESLRATNITKVEAITVLCGNLPLDLCVKNAMIAAEKAGTYIPPIYRGMGRPLMKEMNIFAANVHGEDGLGNMNLPMPTYPIQEKHAIDAIIDLAEEFAGELEIVTCGPLTNLAMAYLKESRLAQWVKKVWILGGSANGKGNMTEFAEYNVYVDPEAASIVLGSGMNMTWVPWDAFQAGGEITPEEAVMMEQSGHPTAEFCIRCVKVLREYHKKAYGTDSFGVIDSAVMTAALYPEIISEEFEAVCSVDVSQGERRGNFVAERTGLLENCEAEIWEKADTPEKPDMQDESDTLEKPDVQQNTGIRKNADIKQNTGIKQNAASLIPNCTVVSKLNMELYKKYLFELLGVENMWMNMCEGVGQ